MHKIIYFGLSLLNLANIAFLVFFVKKYIFLEPLLVDVDYIYWISPTPIFCCIQLASNPRPSPPSPAPHLSSERLFFSLSFLCIPDKDKLRRLQNSVAYFQYNSPKLLGKTKIWKQIFTTGENSKLGSYGPDVVIVKICQIMSRNKQNWEILLTCFL